jgi:hypothetical protein
MLLRPVMMVIALFKIFVCGAPDISARCGDKSLTLAHHHKQCAKYL